MKKDEYDPAGDERLKEIMRRLLVDITMGAELKMIVRRSRVVMGSKVWADRLPDGG